MKTYDNSHDHDLIEISLTYNLRKKMKSNDTILPISLGAGVLLFLLYACICVQGSPGAQSKKDAEAKLLFIDTHTVHINKDHPALPVWIQSSESVARSVRVTIPIIISPHGEFVTLNHQGKKIKSLFSSCLQSGGTRLYRFA